MPGLKDLTNIWKNIREVDLGPIRGEALQSVEITIAGEPGSGRHTLAEQLRSDPARPKIETIAPVRITDLDTAHQAQASDLFILIMDVSKTDFEREQQLARQLSEAGRQVLVFYNKLDLLDNRQSLEQWRNWGRARLVTGSATDQHSLLDEFVPAVMELLPDKALSLGRHFPLMRQPIANELINETCLSNTAYAFSTGIAEIVPALGLPLNIADIIVLTKAQAFLVYKLGLALGQSTRWQDYVTEFGSVIGGGFLWRQLARTLVGLIPVWGIIPKVAVAYAGTYVVGHAVLHWYLTGRHISAKQMRELYRQALTKGRDLARGLVEKTPRRRLGRKRQPLLPANISAKTCQRCGRSNAQDAIFCQYCGQELRDALAQE